MDNNDLLMEQKYCNLFDYLDAKMQLTAEEDLTNSIYEFFNYDKIHAIGWYYYPNKALGGKSPHDYIESGRPFRLVNSGEPKEIKEVKNLVGRIEHGIPS